MDNNIKAQKINNNKSAAGYAKDDTATINIKFVSKEDERTMLQDISNITLVGMQTIDIMREYVENMDLKNYLDQLNQQFARISERCAKYMSAHGVASKFFGSIRQAFQKNIVKINMFTSSSDRKISESMLKGINLGLDSLAKNFNGTSDSLSPELIALAQDFRQVLENSLSELRKYL